MKLTDFVLLSALSDLQSTGASILAAMQLLGIISAVIGISNLGPKPGRK